VDEPTAGLDPEERVRFRNLLSELSGERIVILSTHIVSDVEAVATDIALIAQGGLVVHGIPEALLAGVNGKVWEVGSRAASLARFGSAIWSATRRIVRTVFMRVSSVMSLRAQERGYWSHVLRMPISQLLPLIAPAKYWVELWYEHASCDLGNCARLFSRTRPPLQFSRYASLRGLSWLCGSNRANLPAVS